MMQVQTTSTLWRKALQALRPPEKKPLSEWIEGNMDIPREVSATPGRVRLWSFQRGIADAISDPEIERVTVRKPVRVGYSTLLTGMMLSYAVNEPSPILMVLPTDDDCRDYVVSDLEPIAEATKATKGKLSAGADPNGRSTLTHRRFPGGFLKVKAGRSPRNLRRHNARILAIDEEDGFEPLEEGDPVELAIKRTFSYADRKIVRGSTPKGGATSSIIAAYEDSDQRVFRIGCPYCTHRFQPLWGHLKWPEGRPEEAELECPACEGRIPERLKAQLVEEGDWFARRPEVVGHAGFHLNVLVSLLPNAKWAMLAKEWLAAKDDPAKLRPFVETYLAERWDEGADLVDHEELYKDRVEIGLGGHDEDGLVLGCPEDVLLLTCGVDVQGDRLEATILGFAPCEEDAPVQIERVDVLAHHVIWGSPQDGVTWNELDELLATTWPHPLGGRIKIERTAVDSGDGNNTDAVYAYCWSKPNDRVMAIKGRGGALPPIKASQDKVARRQAPGRGRLWIVGSDTVKSALFNRIKRSSGSVRFSASLQPAWFEQFVSERRVLRKHGGRVVSAYEPVRAGVPVEALDCTVYGYAARQAITTMNIEARRAALGPSKPTRERTQWAAYRKGG